MRTAAAARSSRGIIWVSLGKRDSNTRLGALAVRIRNYESAIVKTDGNLTGRRVMEQLEPSLNGRHQLCIEVVAARSAN